ncbi:MAG TPA: hypothetical protein VH560_06595 [Polyangia bacterium]|jgi:hypothetical protein|nr:hypothetical protein [Polyangia bacterium]
MDAGVSDAGIAGSAAGAAGATGSAGATGTGCDVEVTLTAKGQSMGLIAGPSVLGELTASVTGYTGTPTWSWRVQLVVGGVSTSVTTNPPNDTGPMAEIPLQKPGTLEVQALIVGASMCDRPAIQFSISPPAPPSYLFRVTPPSASRLPISESLLPASAVAGGHTIDLGAGNASDVVSLSPVDARGFPLPSFVRVTSEAFTFDLEAYTGMSAFVAPLSPALSYNVLVVPDSSVAPMRFTGNAAMLQAALGPTVLAGLPVTGSAFDAQGAPVAGTRVLLRNGDLPSTVGVSGADGHFNLSARAGNLSAEIAPPDGSGLPTALVPAGIMLLAQETNLALTMTWVAMSSGDLSVTVRSGGAIVEGARVRADVASVFASVGTLAVEAPGTFADAQLSASGTAEVEGVTDAQGVAHLGRLPMGRYHITVAPPDGSANAVTMADVTLPATGLTTEIALASPVSVTGTLTPIGPTTGATVTAIDQGVLAAPAPAPAPVGAGGAYSLSLAPGRTYELLVAPADGRGLGAGVFSTVTVGPSGGAHDFAVPSGVTWSGSVTGAGRPVAGALVQVFCAAPACIDVTVAVAQGMTRADGSLSLVLPTLSGQ